MKPEDFFGPWEAVVQASKDIAAWQSAQDAINNILQISTANRVLAWRGLRDAKFALHSLLYRRVRTLLGRLPDEGDLIRYEQRLLSRARTLWRYDNLSALELLAHIQHYGGSTRLLDVSLNPFIALWFAVEEEHDKDGRPIADTDGRLFAFDVTRRQIPLEDPWNCRELPWLTRPISTWHTGLPQLWRSPSLNTRIPAQNSAFLLGGVPKVAGGGNSRYRKGREPKRRSERGVSRR